MSEAGDPIARFSALLEEARQLPRETLPEPTAFALGTVNERGQPSVRIVLLKGVDDRGFVFYTNNLQNSDDQTPAGVNTQVWGGVGIGFKY